MKKKIKPDHPPLLPHRADGAMSDRRLSLRECIEAAASSASREARARENAVNNDENNDDRSETVGASTAGAAATTTDPARQDAAPGSTNPTHDTTQGDANMSQHLDGTRPAAQSGAVGSLDSNEELAVRGDAFGYGIYGDEDDGEGEESDTPPDQAWDARDVGTQQALHRVQQMYVERTGKPMDDAQFDAILSLVNSPSATVGYLVDMAMAHHNAIAASAMGSDADAWDAPPLDGRGMTAPSTPAGRVQGMASHAAAQPGYGAQSSGHMHVAPLGLPEAAGAAHLEGAARIEPTPSLPHSAATSGVQGAQPILRSAATAPRHSAALTCSFATDESHSHASTHPPHTVTPRNARAPTYVGGEGVQERAQADFAPPPCLNSMPPVDPHFDVQQDAVETFLAGQPVGMRVSMRRLLDLAHMRDEDYTVLMKSLASDVHNPHLADLIAHFDVLSRRTWEAVRADKGQLVTVAGHWAQQAAARFPNYAVHRLMDDDVAAPQPKYPRRSFRRHGSLPAELVELYEKGRGGARRRNVGTDSSPLLVNDSLQGFVVPPGRVATSLRADGLGAVWGAPTTASGYSCGRGRGATQRRESAAEFDEEWQEAQDQRVEAASQAAEQAADAAADRAALDKEKADFAKEKESLLRGMIGELSPGRQSGVPDVSDLFEPPFWNLQPADGKAGNSNALPQQDMTWRERLDRAPKHKAELKEPPADVKSLARLVDYPQGDFQAYMPSGRQQLLYDVTQLWLYFCAQGTRRAYAADKVSRALIDALRSCTKHGTDRRLKQLDIAEGRGEDGVVEIIHAIDRFLLPADESEIDSAYDSFVWKPEDTFEGFVAQDIIEGRKHLPQNSIQREFTKKVTKQLGDWYKEAEAAEDVSAVMRLRELQKDFVEGRSKFGSPSELVAAARRSRMATTFRPRDIKVSRKRSDGHVRVAEDDEVLRRLAALELGRSSTQTLQTTGGAPPPTGLTFGTGYNVVTKEGKTELRYPALDLNHPEFIAAFNAKCEECGLTDNALQPEVYRNPDPTSEGKFEECPLCRLARALLQLKPLVRSWGKMQELAVTKRAENLPTTLNMDGTEVIRHFKPRCRLFGQVMFKVPAFMALRHLVISDEAFSALLKDAPGPRASPRPGKGKGGK